MRTKRMTELQLAQLDPLWRDDTGERPERESAPQRATRKDGTE
jgi:hypothetical protein